MKTKIILGLFIFLGTSSVVLASDQTELNFPGKAESFKKVHPIFKTSCLPCHSAQLPLPWYGRLPGVQKEMKEEFAHAVEDLDLDAEVYVAGKSLSPETLKNIEKVVKRGKMPPKSYVALHWKARLSKSERDAILNWIQDERARTFSAPASVVQPTVAQPTSEESKKSNNPFKPFES